MPLPANPARLAAMTLGTSLGIFVGIPMLLGPGNVLRLWNEFRIQQVQPQADQQRERVRASWSEGALPPWSGSYGHTSGFEALELDLGPGGFYFEASGCTGTTELAWGTLASVEGALVRLQPQGHVIAERRPPREHGRQRFRFETALYVIPWGEARLLVPAEQMVEFCSLAGASGWDSMEYADYPRRIGLGGSVWEPAPLEGLPQVPAEFRSYLPD